MSVLGVRWISSAVARTMQASMPLGLRSIERVNREVFPEFAGDVSDIEIPAPVAPARAAVYRPAAGEAAPPVHVNFHGGGFVMRGMAFDDPLCRCLAAEAGAVVVNVDYAVAPQHRFPAPTLQAFQVVQWIAAHGREHGWDGARMTVGGQSAGGSIAAAVARQAFELGGPPIALQVLHYAPLDLTVTAKDKPTAAANPVLRPWMCEVFDNTYVPDPAARADRLVSPAGPSDTADLTGIAPALVITPELDRLHDEGARYARRLQQAGALVEHVNVPDADHAYDLGDRDRAREVYTVIARRIRQATE
ncbi:alpha/beta hydrolase [Glycomyces sp. NPDC049804]|uniref:alpha/beta hydrolase n=1 Tax=Glycomyces sp. NPDC049804 TaxID=3154363 RepID=UPI00341902AD